MNSADTGQLVKVYDETGVWEWTYDLRGRTTSQRRIIVDKSNNNTMLGAYSFLWSYNADDSVKQMVYPNMEVVNYTYDNHGRSMGVVGANNYISNYDYDDNGRLVGVTYPNNLDLDMVFVPWDEPVNGGRLYQKTATFTFNARKVLDLAYSYDTIGNIDTLSDRYSMEEWTFTYDDLNRIKDAINSPITVP